MDDCSERRYQCDKETKEAEKIVGKHPHADADHYGCGIHDRRIEERRKEPEGTFHSCHCSTILGVNRNRSIDWFGSFDRFVDVDDQ